MRKTNSAAAIINRLKGRRWNAEDAARILEILARSGETVAGFARRHRIKDQRLIWWKRRLGSRVKIEDGSHAGEPERPIQFVPLVGRDPSEQGTWALGCLAAVNVTDEGFRIELHDATVDTKWVSDLARGLRGTGQ